MNDELINALIAFSSAVFGAVLGAYATYKYQQQESQKTLHNRRIQSYRHCISHLAIMKNNLVVLDRQFLEHSVEKENRHLESKSIGDYGVHLSIDLEKMSYLIDLDEPQLYMELAIAESRYHIVLGSIQHRNECKERFDKLKRPIQREGDRFPHGFEYPPGSDLELKIATDCLYKSVEDAVQSCDLMIDKLNKSLKNYDSSAKGLRYTVIENLDA